jgi:hypothetical protein
MRQHPVVDISLRGCADLVGVMLRHSPTAALDEALSHGVVGQKRPQPGTEGLHVAFGREQAGVGHHLRLGKYSTPNDMNGSSYRTTVMPSIVDRAGSERVVRGTRMRGS